MVYLKSLHHRGRKCVGIFFQKDQRLSARLQREVNAAWSKTHTCWYAEATVANMETLRNIFPSLSADVWKSLTRPVNDEQNIEADPSGSPGQQVVMKSAATQDMAKLSAHNHSAFEKFKRELILKGYSVSTRRTYTGEFLQFLTLIKERAPEDFTEERIKDYLRYCHEVLKLSENTIHSRMNALKFYYEVVLGREKLFWTIPRPKKRLLLPKAISKEQVAAIINAISNLKHRTIITITYACGLRVSEVLSLRVRNVDSGRMILYIESGKGKKDRVVSLSPYVLILLREYYKAYRPKDFLFQGQGGEGHLSARSIQKVLSEAKKKAGVLQAGSMHMLRHSFATHLLEKGIDVVFIQKILGHNDIKTTLKYLHVTNKDLSKIISPIEDLAGLLRKP